MRQIVPADQLGLANEDGICRAADVQQSEGLPGFDEKSSVGALITARAAANTHRFCRLPPCSEGLRLPIPFLAVC